MWSVMSFTRERYFSRPRSSTPCGNTFNAEHGWSQPDDPEPARVEQPGHRAYIEAARLRAGLGLEAEPRDLIRDYLLQRVEHGAVRNRADVVAVPAGGGPGRCPARAAGTVSAAWAAPTERTGWDSNPRGQMPTRFPVVRLKPLGHPS